MGWGYDRKVALGKKMLVEVRICVCRYIDTFHWLRFEEEGGVVDLSRERFPNSFVKGFLYVHLYFPRKGWNDVLSE